MQNRRVLRTLSTSTGVLCLAALLLAIQPSQSFPPWNENSGGGQLTLRPVLLSEQFFGLHTLSPDRHWPSVPFGAMRPAGVSWAALEPEKDHYDWRPLDDWVAQAQIHGVQLDYVFLNVPVWTSTRPTQPCAGKRVGCAAPPHLEDWDNFVRALATRYKGRIGSYELWNEPNASGYWTGTPQQMADLAQHAYALIKSIDPQAVVTTPAASSTGWPLTHDAWFDRYFSAGGGKYADVIAWHGYAGPDDRPALPPEEITQQVRALRAVAQKHHLDTMPIWDTEGGWGKNSQLPDPRGQASFLMRWYLLQFAQGIARAYWYQWDNPDWGTLWRAESGSDPAAASYARVHRWMQGVTAVAPCRPQPQSRLWTCDLQKSDELYRAVWSTEGPVALDHPDDVESFVDSSDMEHAVTAEPLIVGDEPILLKLKTQKAPQSQASQ